MSAFLKPDNLNNVWASGGDRIYPGDTQYATGWQVVIPPRQYFNEIDYKQDQYIAHSNQRGVPEWDAITEYQANKSYIQGSNGTIYRCIVTNTNQNPITDTTNTYWVVAFANAGDFYLKADSDARYLQIANNGSDINNAATFRTNLSVYSQAQTYTQTQVNALTTVASAVQSQQQTSDTVLLSALKLATAFQGTNQNLSANGYQKIPGGLIVQWGSLTTSASSASTVTFPLPFPTNCFVVVGSSLNASVYADTFEISSAPSKTSFQCASVSSGAGGTSVQNATTVWWVALGN